MASYPVAGPSITEKEITYVTKAVTECWYSGANYFIKKFENSFAAYCGRKYAISLPSCTSGLHLSLLAAGIKEGDEVIVPDLTWIASAAPIKYVGAKTILADVRDDNLTLDHNKLLTLVNEKTKAIIAVNLYGAMPDYEALENFCKEKGIVLIEDAAESIGSTYKGKKSGSFGTFSAFSFHGSKTLTTGEGGMLLLDCDELYERCMVLRDHGRTPGDTLFQNKEVGYKYKMTDLQAALGLAQLERVEELISKKREIFDYYYENIKSDFIKISFDSKDVFNSYWMSSIYWDKSVYNIDKFEFISELKKFEIDSRPIFSPLSSLEAYNSSELKSENSVSYKYFDSGINLPSAQCLTKKDLKFITEKVSSILERFRV